MFRRPRCFLRSAGGGDVMPFKSSSAQDLGRGQRTTVGQEGALSRQYALLNGSSQEPESNTLTGHSLCGRRGRRRRQGIDRVKESRFMSDLDRLRIWDDSAVRGALAWY